MNREIVLVCVTAVVIALLGCWQSRYVFLSPNQARIAVGDRWTGCVNYSREQSRQRATAGGDKIDEFLDKADPAMTEKYGQIIVGEC